MEKIDVLIWRRDGIDVPAIRRALTDEVGPGLLEDDSARITELVVHTADTDDAIPKPSLLMGRGAELSAVVTVWLDSIDDRATVVDSIAAATLTAPGDGLDAYLVTESVPQRRTDRDWADGMISPGITHFTCFPQPTRLSDADFYRGWHDIHTPASFRLHPLRWEYVRDSVVRPLTPIDRPLAAIVFERFRTIEDYTDPARLYGGPETLTETMEHLPLYADYEDLDSRPLHEFILR